MGGATYPKPGPTAQVLDVYQFLFQNTAAGLNNPAFVLTAQDRADILAHMRFGLRREL